MYVHVGASLYSVCVCVMCLYKLVCMYVCEVHCFPVHHCSTSAVQERLPEKVRHPIHMYMLYTCMCTCTCTYRAHSKPLVMSPTCSSVQAQPSTTAFNRVLVRRW